MMIRSLTTPFLWTALVATGLISLSGCGGGAFSAGDDNAAGAAGAAGGQAGAGAGAAGVGGDGGASGLCEPGEVRCDDPSHLSVCNGDGDAWEQATACEEHSVCDVPQGRCVCKPNATFCDGAEFHSCGATGDWDVTTCAGQTPMCLDDVGCSKCQPNEATCDHDVLKVCSPNAQSVTETHCGVHEKCDENQKACTCDPGFSYCDDQATAYNTCAQDGVSWNQQLCASDKPLCVDGLGCVACKPGQTECLDHTLRTCSQTGEWQKKQTCDGSTPLCNAALGACTACVPGDVICAGPNLRTCSQNGLNWGNTTCSGGTPLCNPTLKKCTACVPGEAECQLNNDGTSTVRVCQPDGMTFKESAKCSPNLCDVSTKACLSAPSRAVARLSLGDNYACAIVKDSSNASLPGEVRCWGDNTDHCVAPAKNGWSGYDHRVAAAYWTAQPLRDNDNVSNPVIKAYAIATAKDHACAVVGTNRTVTCWGANTKNDLGTESNYRYPGPATVKDSPQDVDAVAVGASVSCALSHGHVFCWGECNHDVKADSCNDYEVKNVLPSTSSLRFDRLKTARYSNLTCARELHDHSVLCWNHGVRKPRRVILSEVSSFTVTSKGSLGYIYYKTSAEPTKVKVLMFMPNSSNDGWSAASPSEVDSNADSIMQMSAEGQVFVGVRKSHKLTSDPTNSFGATASRVAVNGHNTCVLTTVGTVRCGGSTSYGVNGNGLPLHNPNPLHMLNLSGVTSSWMGEFSQLIYLKDGSAVASGSSSALFGNAGPRLMPSLFANGAFQSSQFVSLARGTSVHDDDQRAYLTPLTGQTTGFSKGSSLDGKLLLKSTCAHFKEAYSTTFVDIGLCDTATDKSVILYASSGAAVSQFKLGLKNIFSAYDVKSIIDGAAGIVQIAPPTRVAKHLCVLDDKGAVWCWGNNGHREVGIDSSGAPVDKLTNVPLGTAQAKAKQVAITDSASCALSTQGDVYCWGYGYYGCVGAGDWANTAVATRVHGLTTPVKSIATGPRSVCALQNDNTVACWGYGGYGQLGDPAFNGRSSNVAHRVPGLSNVVRLAGGQGTYCAQLQDGTMSCWGANPGGISGNGRSHDAVVPQLVTGLN